MWPFVFAARVRASPLFALRCGPRAATAARELHEFHLDRRGRCLPAERYNRAKRSSARAFAVHTVRRLDSTCEYTYRFALWPAGPSASVCAGRLELPQSLCTLALHCTRHCAWHSTALHCTAHGTVLGTARHTVDEGAHGSSDSLRFWCRSCAEAARRCLRVNVRVRTARPSASAACACVQPRRSGWRCCFRPPTRGPQAALLSELSSLQ
jgi:hypothetical protein